MNSHSSRAGGPTSDAAVSGITALRRRRAVPAWPRVALAVGLVAGITLLAAALRGQLPEAPGLFLYIPPIAALAYLTGRGAGFGAALLSIVAAWYFLLPPAGTWSDAAALAPTFMLFAIAAFGTAEGFARAREAERRHRAAEQAQAHLAAIVAASDDAIFSKSMDAVILSWNPAAERLYGYTPDEIIGRPAATLVPSDRPGEIPGIMVRLARGEAITHLETVRVRKDGTRVDVSLTISPIRDAAGRIVAASTSARDISARLRLEQRQRVLIDVIAALSGAATPNQVAHAVVEHAARGLAASAAALWLATRDGTFELIASMGYSEEFAGRWRFVAPGQDRNLDEAMTTGAVVWQYTEPEAAGPVQPGRRQIVGAVVPLLLQTVAAGALSLRFRGPIDVDAAGADFMLTLGRQCGQAFERARLYAQEHHMAATLQHALLPAGIPEVPGIRIRAVYAPSAREPGVGGDWYDVFRLPDGRVALAIGDVVGRGVEAAVVMGQVRQAVRAAALEGHPPAETLAIASQVLRLSHEHEGMTTAVFGIFDPLAVVFTYATAGHPAPIVAGPNGVRTLPSGGLPLGFMDAPAAPSWTAELAPGALLVLHTDGLVEATRDPAGGQAALMAAVADEARDRSPDAARTILTRVVGGAAPDDVAVVTVALDPRPVDRLDITLPAQPSSLRLMRHALRQVSTNLGLHDDAVSALMIASGEAVNNVIEHAYGASAGTVFLRARPEGGSLRVEVQDRGTWRAQRAHTTGGRGLDLIRALVDEVDIATTPAGTTVRFAVPLPTKTAAGGQSPAAEADGQEAPAHDSAGAASAASAREERPDGTVVRRTIEPLGSGRPAGVWENWRTRIVDDVPVVEIAGDVDLDNVGRFKTMIQDAAGHARNGTVVLSLTQARYFDSQGLRALLLMARRLATMRCMLLLVIGPDAPLRPVLRAMDVASVLLVFNSLPDAITAARVRETGS